MVSSNIIPVPGKTPTSDAARQAWSPDDDVRGSPERPLESASDEPALKNPFLVALGERVRAALQEHLPDGPPFTDLAPSVQVESILGPVLVADDTAQKMPKFEDLIPIGIDGVLYVDLGDWGVDDLPGGAGKAFYMRGTGRMFTLPGNSTLWRAPIEMHGEPLSGRWLEVQSVRQKLHALATSTGEQVAILLGGSVEQPRPRDLLNTPEITSEGHPPEKLPPVLPYGFVVDGGPRKDPPLIQPFSVDGGDSLFPGIK